MMKKIIALTLTLLLIIGGITIILQPAIAKPVASYYSAASTWAEEELKKADTYGLIPSSIYGDDMTRFITREEFAELVVKLYEKATKKNASAPVTNPFTDTKNTEILKAYNIGITTGTSATTFAPKESTTREQVATMLSRVIRLIAPNGDFSGNGAPVFTDQKDISAWALEHVLFMSKIQIIKGTDGRFMPRPITVAQQVEGYAITTREQALAMCVRILEQYSVDTAVETPKAVDLLGKWSYSFSAGVNGQTLNEIEFRKDGTFTYMMAIVISTGSGITSNTYGVAASSDGNYKIIGDNKILLYNSKGGRCEENKTFSNLYEIIERSYTIRDTKIDDMEFLYEVENTSGTPTLTMEPVVEIGVNRFGFGLLTKEDPLSLINR